MNKLRTLVTAKELYQQCKNLRLKFYAKDQLCRAALSVCLNLAEGDARKNQRDRIKFFNIAFASLREVQALLWVENISSLEKIADHCAAQIYKLINAKRDT